MDVVAATRRYDEWLATRMPILEEDLALKHDAAGTGDERHYFS